jgi:cell division protein FtsZ
MEGRLRVSVVATGIEAEAMQKATPNNVEPLRPHRRVSAPPLPVRPETKTPEVRVMASPVHHQMETLQQELAQRQPVEHPMPLGASPIMPEEEPVPVYHTVVRTAPVRQQPLPEPEEAPKRRFGFLGRREKKPEPARIEPAQAQRQPQQRASAQVIQRGAQAEPQRGVDRNMDTGDDLFPEHKKDDQFEIPAFLRRQTN